MTVKVKQKSFIENVVASWKTYAGIVAVLIGIGAYRAEIKDTLSNHEDRIKAIEQVKPDVIQAQVTTHTEQLHELLIKVDGIANDVSYLRAIEDQKKEQADAKASAQFARQTGPDTP